MHIININEQELEQINAIISELSSRHETIESEKIILDCEDQIPKIPSRIIQQLITFSRNRFPGPILLKGYRINDEMLDDSPVDWNQPWSKQSYLEHELFHFLISSVVGVMFGWKTQENGRMLRHITPIKVEEIKQLGGSSSVELQWHTEEAFHEAKADFISIMCYRNFEKAKTNFVSVYDLELSENVKEILSDNRFHIIPDESHSSSYNEIHKIDNDFFKPKDKKYIPILHGSSSMPMMTVDQAFTEVKNQDPEAKKALFEFYKELDKQKKEVILEPGDLIIINNLTTVHGRSIYSPMYGPKQRWLRRVNIRNSFSAKCKFEFDDKFSTML